MATGKVLALDLGARRVGIAVSDRARSLAFPRPMLDRRVVDVHHEIAALIEEESIATVVVGLPRSLSGAHSASTFAIETEIADLRAALALRSVDVVTVDERLTTVEASRRLRDAGVNAKDGRAHIDSAAATVILETYLLGQRQ